MLIETLDKLLKEKKTPTAFARIPDKNGQRASNTVEVAFSASGRVYAYKGSILSVAERLELIPEIWAGDEGERIVKNFFDGITGYAVAFDTVRATLVLPEGKDVDYKVVSQDEFGRDIAQFFIREKSRWI